MQEDLLCACGSTCISLSGPSVRATAGFIKIPTSHVAFEGVPPCFVLFHRGPEGKKPGGVRQSSAASTMVTMGRRGKSALNRRNRGGRAIHTLE